MRSNTVPLPVLAAALTACTIEPELLNSERIEERFGSYGIEVLDSEPGMRRSNLYSLNGGVPVCRTYAVVQFTDGQNPMIGAEHAQILAGDSIGAIFKANGWAIHKQTLHVGTVELGNELDGGQQIVAMMRLPEPRTVAMHAYRLILKKDGQAVDYGIIVEVHHPEYLAIDELSSLFPVDPEVHLDADQISALANLATHGPR